MWHGLVAMVVVVSGVSACSGEQQSPGEGSTAPSDSAATSSPPSSSTSEPEPPAVEPFSGVSLELGSSSVSLPPRWRLGGVADIPGRVLFANAPVDAEFPVSYVGLDRSTPMGRSRDGMAKKDMRTARGTATRLDDVEANGVIVYHVVDKGAVYWTHVFGIGRADGDYRLRAALADDPATPEDERTSPEVDEFLGSLVAGWSLPRL